jgi:hypothetical protein
MYAFHPLKSEADARKRGTDFLACDTPKPNWAWLLITCSNYRLFSRWLDELKPVSLLNYFALSRMGSQQADRLDKHASDLLNQWNLTVQSNKTRVLSGLSRRGTKRIEAGGDAGFRQTEWSRAWSCTVAAWATAEIDLILRSIWIVMNKIYVDLCDQYFH